jgi:hypothetical protein
MQKTLLQSLDGQSIHGLKFCGLVYGIFENVRATPEGIEALRMRRGKCKKLVEELLPICKYIQGKYRPDRYISVTWIDGNQTYDAELRSVGEYVVHGYYPANSFVEVTCIVHPNEYLAREHINAGDAVFGLDGLTRMKDRKVNSIPKVHVGEIFIENYADLVLTELVKKSVKPYPDRTTLVMQCSLNRLYFPNEWAKLISSIEDRIPTHPFIELFLHDPVSEYSSSIYAPPASGLKSKSTLPSR